jgi:N-methylhydantoinase A
VRQVHSALLSAISQSVWFGADGPFEVPLVERSRLVPGTTLEGPLVITQFDATTLVPPGCRLCVEAEGHIVIRINP